MLTAVHQKKITCGTQQSTYQFGFLHIGIYSQLAETKATCNNNIYGGKTTINKQLLPQEMARMIGGMDLRS
jgi:hypothetical protein